MSGAFAQGRRSRRRRRRAQRECLLLEQDDLGPGRITKEVTVLVALCVCQALVGDVYVADTLDSPPRLTYGLCFFSKRDAPASSSGMLHVGLDQSKEQRAFSLLSLHLSYHELQDMVGHPVCL